MIPPNIQKWKTMDLQRRNSEQHPENPYRQICSMWYEIASMWYGIPKNSIIHTTHTGNTTYLQKLSKKKHTQNPHNTVPA
jgi:hypothetical protein